MAVHRKPFQTAKTLLLARFMRVVKGKRFGGGRYARPTSRRDRSAGQGAD
ncbi:MAG: hypothetical protein NTW86_32130 [Candidatus Sumerlaeota bacterium]|nr:hypothetical protein [Candidatus Sumerlaeota bacterium]